MGGCATHQSPSLKYMKGIVRSPSPALYLPPNPRTKFVFLVPPDIVRSCVMSNGLAPHRFEMIYPNEIKKGADYATRSRPHLDKCSASPIWRLAVERVVDQADDLIVLAEVGGLDYPTGIAKKSQRSIARATRMLAPFSENIPAWKLVVDFAAVLTVLFSLQYHLEPLDLLLAGVVGTWIACRATLVWVQAATKAANDINSYLDELCLAMPQLYAAEEGCLTQSAQGALLEVYILMAQHLIHNLRFVGSHQRVLLHQRAWTRLATQSSSAVWQHRKLVAIAEAECLKSKTARERLEIVQQKQPSYGNVPARFVSRFHGRDDALQAIAIALRPGQAGCGELRSFVLFGIGGVGKTEIAHQYVAQHRKDYSTIFWVNASNVETLRDGFEEIAQLIETELQGPQSPMTRVHNWLNDTDQTWLMVVDGADDLEILEKFWPGNGRGSVLITTRDHTGAQERRLDSVYNVRPFKPAESAKFLLNSIGMYNPSPDDREVAKGITCRLGHLPLTLNQASGFIVRRQLSLRDFMYKYRLQPDAEEIDELKSCGGYPRSVASVWEDTFSRIPEKSMLFLNILAFMRSKGVKEEVLYLGSVLLRRAHPEMGREGWKLMLFMNESMEMSEAQEVLLKWGLISRDPQAGFVSMLRAVRQQTIRRLGNDEREHFSFIAREIQRLVAEKEEGGKAERMVSGFAGCMQKQQPEAEKLTPVRPPALCEASSPTGPPRGKTRSEFAANLVTQSQAGDCQRVVRPSMMRPNLTAPPLKKRSLADLVAFMATQPPGGSKSSVAPAIMSTERARAAEARAYQMSGMSRPSSSEDLQASDSEDSETDT
ncbi:hypothetical protein PgNI_10316 [Pyricularia grisea]|uniref:NB-ARC domain-containing protein n=1 Tax=Pyricularia grisea TaxID=148305 RepID=A0A6P8AZM6_PYRGI|nr:hypothetical protein PgNI_10316 [Pyricularia grisea]TLD07785.1 hypothetical protein PgNI_10316 [Pyricularia grisea]